MQIRPEGRYRPNPRLADQALGGKSVILNYEGKRILGLNESGSALWTLLDGTRSLQAVAETLAAESDAPAEEILEDVLAFAQDLAERGLLVEDEDGDAAP